MNLQQFGTHIGFFLLTAALAGGLGILLSIGIKPLERSVLLARENVARRTYMDLGGVSKRDILRYSKAGSKTINAMTVTDDDGGALFDDPHEFHAVFKSWCSFKLHRLWALCTRSKRAPHDNQDTSSIVVDSP